MTLGEAIGTFDRIQPNSVSLRDKIRIISDFEGIVKRSVFDTHAGGPEGEFGGYDPSTPMDTELLIGNPFTCVYISWLRMNVDVLEGEYEFAAASSATFDREFNAFCRYINRSRRPKGRPARFR